MDTRRFTVALSFPGEHRLFVEQVAQLLAEGLGEERVLYDHFHDDEFARPNLNVYLPNLYLKGTEVIAVFLCPEYKDKLWCKLEWRFIAQLIGNAGESRILLFSFGDPGDMSDLGILPGDGYIDIKQRNLSPQEVASRILKRLKKDFGIVPAIWANQGGQDACAPSIDLSRIDRLAPENLIGREAELQQLGQAWQAEQTHVLTLHALGGEGKTSLVAHWAVHLVQDPIAGCEAAFAWSFYQQGAEEQASSDLFLREALVFFGNEDDKAMADGPKPAAEKAKRLAALVAGQRALLVLDGVEPLQYPPTAPLAGQFKDPGLSMLLRLLASRNAGLCIVTSRQPLADLKTYWHGAAPQQELKRLSTMAGAALLVTLGVHGSRREREELVEKVQGHALTMNILGAYLRDAHGGDIHKSGEIRLQDADLNADNSGHAFRCLDTYVAWLDSATESQPALALLRLCGLFDRPITPGCWDALLKPPAIPGLTEALFTVKKRWLGMKREYLPPKCENVNIWLNRLSDAKLLSVNRDHTGRLISIDAHPLTRAYFAEQLRNSRPEAWREAHARLYRHLRDNTKGLPEPKLEDFLPLYQAVAHGCRADLYQSAFDGRSLK